MIKLVHYFSTKWRYHLSLSAVLLTVKHIGETNEAKTAKVKVNISEKGNKKKNTKNNNSTATYIPHLILINLSGIYSIRAI